MSNIKEVARLAGVAPSTVSNVFTHNKYVSPEITRRVQAVCEKLNYSPSLIASGMRTRKTKLLGLFLSSSQTGFPDFYHDLIEGTSITASEYGYSVILYYGVTDEAKLRSILENGRGPIEGALLLTPRTKDFRTHKLALDNIPYLLIGKSDEQTPFVDVQNDRITYDITRRLIEEGRRTFLFLNGEADLCISDDRLKGYRQALDEAGIPYDEGRVLNIQTDKHAAYYETMKLLDEATDAVIVESDISGQGAYEAVASRGRTDRVKVCALGGTSVADTMTPRMTTVRVDYNKLGGLSVRRLIERLQGEPASNENYIDAEILFR